jgi:radical SAM protein with 4Fe4S-binding SPASM domain
MHLFSRQFGARLKDGMRFIRTISFRKLINLGKIYVSFHLSRIRSKAYHYGMPSSISIEPTTACNLRCPECPSGLRQFTRPTGNLKKDFFSQIVDEVYKDVCTLMFYFQGEPFINPDFLKMVAYAHEKKIYTITSTNGHFLSDSVSEQIIKSGLDRLIISVDGLTQETYEQYRIEGKLDKVIEGIKNVVRWKKKLKSAHPYIIIQYLVVRPNEHEVPGLEQWAKDIGADGVRLKTAQVYDFEYGNPLIPEQIKYSRYKQNADGTWMPKHELSNQCWRLWQGAVVTWDGRVVPCCFDKDAQYKMGDLKQDSFKTIWKGEPYKQFRSNLLKGRKNIDICKNCSEGCTIWA